MATLYLNVQDRFYVQQLLPTTGAVSMLRQFRTFTESLLLSEAEQAEIGFVIHPNGTGAWKTGPGAPATVRKAFSVPEAVLTELVTACKKLDSESRFPSACLELWDQIVDGKVPSEVTSDNTGTD